MSSIFKDPIVVLGTGRSGTSVVAGMLYNLGVDMGDEFEKADNNNITGTYEDSQFTQLIRSYVYPRLAGNQGLSYEKFRHAMSVLIRMRGAQGKDWGWKIPVTSNVVDVVLDIVPEAKFIWCKRDFDESVKSCERAYGWSKDRAEEFLRPRQQMLEKHLSDNNNTLEIGFDEILETPEAVVDQLVAFAKPNATHEEIESAEKLVFDKSETENAKVWVICPSKKLNIHASAHRMLSKMEHDDRYDVTMEIFSANPISNSRNQIAKKAVEDNFDFVVMLDDDVGPTKNPLDLIKMNKDVVGLPTPIWQNNKLMMNAVIKGGSDYWPVPGSLQQQVPVEVDAVGTGCIIIKTEVLRALTNPFETIFDEDGIKVRGEDFAFCTKAKEAGFEIWTHFGYPCEHWCQVNLLKLLREFKKFEGK